MNNPIENSGFEEQALAEQTDAVADQGQELNPAEVEQAVDAQATATLDRSKSIEANYGAEIPAATADRINSVGETMNADLQAILAAASANNQNIESRLSASTLTPEQVESSLQALEQNLTQLNIITLQQALGYEFAGLTPVQKVQAVIDFQELYNHATDWPRIQVDGVAGRQVVRALERYNAHVLSRGNSVSLPSAGIEMRSGENVVVTNLDQGETRREFALYIAEVAPELRYLQLETSNGPRNCFVSDNGRIFDQTGRAVADQAIYNFRQITDASQITALEQAYQASNETSQPSAQPAAFADEPEGFGPLDESEFEDLEVTETNEVQDQFFQLFDENGTPLTTSVNYAENERAVVEFADTMYPLIIDKIKRLYEPRAEVNGLGIVTPVNIIGNIEGYAMDAAAVIVSTYKVQYNPLTDVYGFDDRLIDPYLNGLLISYINATGDQSMNTSGLKENLLQTVSSIITPATERRRQNYGGSQAMASL